MKDTVNVLCLKQLGLATSSGVDVYEVAVFYPTQAELAMDGCHAPSSQLFCALQSGDVKQLCGFQPQHFRPFLPCLVRMSLSPTPSHSLQGQHSQERRKVVLALIAGVVGNS